MKQTSAVAYLRQLCCSGLPKEVVIPEFLRAVQTVIPSGNNVLSGINKQYFPYYFLLGFPAVVGIDDLVPLAIDAAFSFEQRRLALERFKKEPVVNVWYPSDPSFYRSDLYNLVLLPHDQHFGLHALAKGKDGQYAVVSLYRSPRKKSFECPDKELLASLLPYVSYALQATGDQPTRYCEQGETDLLLLSTEGNLLYLSDHAKYLLSLALSPSLTANNISFQKSELARRLTHLCSNLNAIFEGKDAPPPTFSHINPRGRFIFRAYWLNKQTQEPGNLIGMTVEYQEPALLKILRGLQRAPLSPTQKEVAALMAQGLSADNICTHLHIKPTTLKDHTRKLYLKLDINKRDELLPKLLALAEPPCKESDIPIIFH